MCAFEQAAFEEAYWAVNSLKVFSATGIGGSSHNPVDQTDTNAAVSANRRDATEAASNATHGFHITNRLLLQQDSQVQRGEYLLQLHVHRESRECIVLCLWVCCLLARFGAAVRADKYICSPLLLTPLRRQTAKYTNPNGPCSTSIVVLTPSSDLDIRPDSVPSIVVMCTFPGAGRLRDDRARCSHAYLAASWFHCLALGANWCWCDRHNRSTFGGPKSDGTFGI